VTTLTWPTVSVDPTRCEWWLQGLTQEHRSPLSGAVQTQELPGAHWTARIEYHNVRDLDARTLQAFIGKMRGRAGRVYVPNFGRPSPVGVGGGTPVVAGAGQTGATLNVSGGPLSTTGWLLAGDAIGVNSQIYMLTADATTDGSGAAALSIAPPLRSSPASLSSITLTLPTFVGMFTDDRQGWTYEPGARGFHTFIFDLTEVF